MVQGKLRNAEADYPTERAGHQPQKVSHRNKNIPIPNCLSVVHEVFFFFPNPVSGGRMRPDHQP